MSHLGNVVWILGAGFSRSLGGPLLNDLFTHERTDRVLARFPHEHPEALARVRKQFRDITNLYQRVTEKEAQNKPQWIDPEQFIEFLNRAAADSEGWAGRMLASHLQIVSMDSSASAIRLLPKRARQYLAAVCHEFASEPEEAEKAERWFPYRRWAREVAAHKHRIISFNYDRVVELASNDERVPWHPEREGGKPNFLKLHGSLEWRDDLMSLNDGESVYEAVAAGRDFSLAIPGPDKASTAVGAFKRLWEQAETFLGEADVIIFVGYRFPESDAVAKQRILGAIKASSHRITVRLVLGPQRDQHVQRVEGMLKWALAGRTIVDPSAYAGRNTARHSTFAAILHEPMYAEDFLTVFEPERLNAFVQG